MWTTFRALDVGDWFIYETRFYRKGDWRTAVTMRGSAKSFQGPVLVQRLQ